MRVRVCDFFMEHDERFLVWAVLEKENGGVESGVVFFTLHATPEVIDSETHYVGAPENPLGEDLEPRIGRRLRDYWMSKDEIREFTRKGPRLRRRTNRLLTMADDKKGDGSKTEVRSWFRFFFPTRTERRYLSLPLRTKNHTKGCLLHTTHCIMVGLKMLYLILEFYLFYFFSCIIDLKFLYFNIRVLWYV